MQFNDIGNLVGRTVRLRRSISNKESVFYQGKLEKYLVPGWYKIHNPLVFYPDGTTKQEDGWRIVRERDFKEGRVTSLPH